MRRLELAQHGLGIDRAHVREVDRLQRVDHLGALRAGSSGGCFAAGVGVRGDVAQQRAAHFASPG